VPHGELNDAHVDEARLDVTRHGLGVSSIVRPVAPKDADAVIALVSGMYEAMGMDPSDPAWRLEADRLMRDGGGQNDRAIFVVDVQGEIVACGGVTVATRLPGPRVPDARVAYVQWMATGQRHRRRGHAHAILNAILSWARESGVSLIELHATPMAEGLYRRNGFEEARNPSMRLSLMKAG
jgi:GNAT superfamily N-acetyltransferase